MKAALIGNGIIAVDHRMGYQTLRDEGSDIELVAICDIREERLEESFTDGARVYTSVDEMLEAEKDLDFVDICVPTYLHAEYSIKCMEAGIHVLCEKPMALKYEDTQRMIECSERTGKKLMIAHSCRFCHGTLETKKFIESGKFGKVQSAFFKRANGRPGGRWEDWMDKAELSGGAMYDFQAHDVDLAVWFLGVPKAVSTVAAKRKEGGGYDSVCANLIYDNGVFANIWVDWAVRKNKFANEFHRINFEKGYIYCAGGSFVAVDEDGNETDLNENKTLTGTTKKNEIEYFASCIKEDKYPEWCPPEQSSAAIKTICGEVKSADKSGVPMYLD